MSISVARTSFTGGEWTDSLFSRTDHAKYPTACKTMRNFFAHPHGGASNRAGLELINSSKTHSKRSRVRRFQFNTVQSYMLEFGDGYIRVYKDGGRVISAKNVTGAANNGSGLIRLTVTAHGFYTGNTVTVASVGGVPNATGTWIITVIDANTIDLQASTFAGTYTSGGTATAIVEIPTSYLEADLPLLKFEQSADTLYIWHPSYKRSKLTRTSHVLWTLTAITTSSKIAAPGSVAIGGSGRNFAVTAIDGDEVESALSTPDDGAYGNTITWAAVTGAKEYNIYAEVDGIYKFIGRSAALSFAVPASPTIDDGVTAPQVRDPFGNSGSGNCPGCGAFFDQRLVNARTDNRPQTLNGSVVGDFENHNVSSPIQDDDAFTFTIDSNQVNEIRWMAALDDLILGTSGGEWRLFPGSQSDSITPISAQLKRQSEWGCANMQPLIIGKSLLFVDATNKKVRDLFYQIDPNGNQAYAGTDLTILADHLFEDYGISEWAFERGRNNLIWSIRTDGISPSMTYHKEHQISGWSWHETHGYFESVDCIQNSDGTTEVWFVVRRTIGGQTKRFIERLHSRDFTDIEDAFFVDCGLSFDNSISATLTPGANATTQGSTGVTFTAGSSVFVLGDVGREIHYRYISSYDDNRNPIYKSAKAEITGYTSGTVVTATILLEWPSLSAIASGDWRMSVTQVSGFTHLEGETVVALADGAVFEDLVVSSGTITFPQKVSKGCAGFGYTCDLETLGFDYPTQTGTVQDKIRFLTSAIFRFRKTREAFVGPDLNNLNEVPFRDQERLGEPTGLFNGDKEQFLNQGDPRAGRAAVRVTGPVPCTVQAIIARMDNGEQ